VINTYPERRGVSGRRVIEEAKAKVPVIDLADLLCGPGKMRRMGERWVSRCPLPGHEDRSPSFTVYLATNSWYCFGACQRGGDVVDLAAAAWGYEKHEAAMAAAHLLHEFGHPIPERPPSWSRKQERQKPVRDALEQIKIDILRRRLFRIVWPMLRNMPQPQRDAEARIVWEELEDVAADYLARRGEERAG